MNWLHAIVLGVVEGITEFLPISSTGHLTIAEHLLGYRPDESGVKAFTAVIQVGAILAAVLFFFGDIARIVAGWFKGLTDRQARGSDYRMGWSVIIGSIPVALVGLALKRQIEGLGSLWVVAAALVLWSAVLFAADRFDTAERHEEHVTWQDALFIGVMQCFSLIPGVSRSGATISAGMFRRFDRLTATRLSFFLGIPALVAAGGLEAASQFHEISAQVGWGQTLVGGAVAFVTAYLTIAWLLRFVSSNRFTGFIVYRVAAGVLLGAALLAGWVQ